MDVDLLEPSETTPARPIADLSGTASPQVPTKGSSFHEDGIEFLIDDSAPAPQPSAWKFLPPVDSVRCLQRSRPALIVKWNERFGAKQDGEASDGTHRSISEVLERLRPDGCDTLIVEYDEAKRPQGIYTADRSLFPTTAPVVDRALARVDNPTKSAPMPLFVTTSVEDLHVLRGLGLSTVLSFGLREMNKVLVDGLYGDDPSNDHLFRYQLILMDWNVAKMQAETRPNATQILVKLSLMQYLYGHDPARRVTRWRPSSNTLNKFSDAVRFADVELILKLLRSKLPDKKLGQKWQFHLKPKQEKYAEARARLATLIAKSESFTRARDVREAVDQLRKLYHDQVLAGVYEMAELAKSPMDRAVIFNNAEWLEKWFETQPILHAAREVMANRHPGSGWEVDNDCLNERRRITDTIFRLSKFSLAAEK